VGIIVLVFSNFEGAFQAIMLMRQVKQLASCNDGKRTRKARPDHHGDVYHITAVKVPIYKQTQLLGS
jgi:hypothetical protein